MRDIRPVLIRLEALEARLDARRKASPGQLALDLSGGDGQPCGKGWIARDKTCHKGAGSVAGTSRFMALAKITQERKAAEEAARKKQQAAPTSGIAIGLPEQGNDQSAPLVGGQPPRKGLGGGAYGDTYLYELSDGRKLVVKVDRLQNIDPMDTGMGKDQETQRWDMVNREHAAMTRANELGLGPKPLSSVQKLSDGRLAFAYEFVDGVKVWKDHRETRLTQEAFDLLEQPGMRGKVAKEVGRIARTMAESGFEHGDAHGGNVLIGTDGRITLIDWGYSSQAKENAPTDKASIELRTVEILGGQLGVTGPVDMRAGRGGVKDKITGGGPIYRFEQRIREARTAESKTIRAYEREWENDPANVLEDPGAALLQANKLKKELGISFREAEGMVGLEAPLTPEIKARAAAARDAVFGERQLKVMRRMLDTHFNAWENYAPPEEAA